MTLNVPDEWKDDQAMDVLFSPFREARDVNPHSWDKKMVFWTNLILKHCSDTGTVLLNTNQLPRVFERKGKIPVCLNKVLQELVRERKLQKVEEFLEDNSTWLQWGFNWAIKKPASWTLNTFVKKPLTWTYSKFLGNDGNEAEKFTRLVVIQVLKEKAEILWSRHNQSVANETTDSVIGYDVLYNHNKDMFSDQNNFHITLLKLVKDKKCAIFETENHHKVVRFAKTDKRSVTPPNDCDVKIYKLKLTDAKLQDQIEKLTLESNRLREDAKMFIRKGMKPSALSTLRKKKKVEAVRSQKETALDNIHQLIIAIEQADSNKMVLDAYSSGNEAFKQISKEYGLTPDVIDDVMTDMEETFDLQDDINKSMSQQPTSVTEPSIEELENELSFILSGGGDDSSFGGDLPEVPQQEPVGFSDIPFSTGKVVSPQQDLVDAMCRMRVLPEDEDLELPDVPSFSLDTFSPESKTHKKAMYENPVL